MPPITPYSPQYQQAVPLQNNQSNVAHQNFVSKPTASLSADFDWIVRFCLLMIAVPRLFAILQAIIQKISYVGSTVYIFSAGYIFAGFLNLLLICFVFFVYVRFISASQDYKKVLIAFFIITITAPYLSLGSLPFVSKYSQSSPTLSK